MAIARMLVILLGMLAIAAAVAWTGRYMVLSSSATSYVLWDKWGGDISYCDFSLAQTAVLTHRDPTNSRSRLGFMRGLVSLPAAPDKAVDEAIEAARKRIQDRAAEQAQQP